MTETTPQSGVQGGRLFFESASLEDGSKSGFGVHLAAGGLAATSDIPGGNALWELTAAVIAGCSGEGARLPERSPSEVGGDAGSEVRSDMGPSFSDLGSGPEIVVEPSFIDFGQVGPDCPVPRSVTVTNLGPEALDVRLLVDGPGFEAEGTGLRIPGFESRDFFARFTAAAPATWEASALVEAIGRHVARRRAKRLAFGAQARFQLGLRGGGDGSDGGTDRRRTPGPAGPRPR
ncbi:MAG: hypothetical protein AAGD10_06775 [Myxococcota bacterium]